MHDLDLNSTGQSLLAVTDKKHAWETYKSTNLIKDQETEENIVNSVFFHNEEINRTKQENDLWGKVVKRAKDAGSQINIWGYEAEFQLCWNENKAEAVNIRLVKAPEVCNVKLDFVKEEEEE